MADQNSIPRESCSSSDSEDDIPLSEAINSTRVNAIRETCKSSHCQSSKGNCEKFSETDRELIFDHFWANTWKKRSEYVKQYVNRSGKDENLEHHNSFSYSLPLNGTNLPVCRTMFVNTLGIDIGNLRAWIPGWEEEEEDAKRVDNNDRATEKKTEKETTTMNLKEKCEISEKELNFYAKLYKDLSFVTTKKIHCTVCQIHIGTSADQQDNINTHPILRVTLCKSCFDFYNVGEFVKGDDGSEFYCRWCGQGGDVYCCSVCPFVFCKSCIEFNLSSEVVHDIEENDLWKCFRCVSKILWPLRAQHWALKRYVAEQRKKIDSMKKSGVTLISADSSKCCKNSTENGKHVGNKRASEAEKINSNAEVTKRKNCVSNLEEPDQKRSKTDSLSTIASEKGQKQMNISQPTPKLLAATSSCPPGLTRIRHLSTMKRTYPEPAKTLPGTQKSLPIRGTTPATQNSPIFTIINGFRVDLNAAAHQQVIRLPNGRLIQVKRRAQPTTQPATSQTKQKPMPFVITQLPQRPMHSRTPQTSIAVRPALNTQQRSVTIEPTTILTMNNGPTPLNEKTPFVVAKSHLDRQLGNGKNVCHHLVDKIQILSNSNAYKSAKNYMDLKELYIHVSYMLSYSIERLKGMQDKFLGDMRGLGFSAEAENLEKGKLAGDREGKSVEKPDDDIEIVEQVRDTINIDSDDESDEPVTKSQPICTVPSKDVVPLAKISNDVIENSKQIDVKIKTEKSGNEGDPLGCKIVDSSPCLTENAINRNSDELIITLNPTTKETNLV